MRPLVALTQRVDEVADFGERRDAIDQRWFALLDQAGFLPLPLPNRPGLALELVHRLQPDGLILTGGNSLVAYGGTAPERDGTESELLAFALNQGLPVLGVCRGMQVLLTRFGQHLQAVQGHVKPEQTIVHAGQERLVNSYHNWGCYEVPEGFSALARAKDGVIKAIRHLRYPLEGIMWHPERMTPFADLDIELLRSLFAAAS